METSLDLFLSQIDILSMALIAGVLIVLTHVPLGQEVLKRGIIFLDLAIAQIAAVGYIVADILFSSSHGQVTSPWLQQFFAIFAAISGAFVLYQLRHLSAKFQEAFIGIMFMLATTGAILLMASDPHGGEKLKAMMTGQILWVTTSDLVYTAVVYCAVLGTWYWLRSKLNDLLFYPLFAITITLSTQLVGVYLVFTSLIVPAIASSSCQKQTLWAYLIGISGYLIGLILSSLYDYPSGAMIAWTMVIIAGAFGLLKNWRNLPLRKQTSPQSP